MSIAESLMAHRPLVAILRGVTPDEIVEIAHAIANAGITIIEVPLNSPQPLESIGRLTDTLGHQCLCGAGTVLTAEQVAAVRDQGGQLIVSPNTDPGVIASAADAGMVVMPGFATATEAFTAVSSGATGLKLFPASAFDPSYVKALGAVLPAEVPLFAVGGVGADAMQDWLQAGAAGFGIGGDLYRPGATAEQVAEKAARLVAAYDHAAAACS